VLHQLPQGDLAAHQFLVFLAGGSRNRAAVRKR
jgi:hypothetical protein